MKAFQGLVVGWKEVEFLSGPVLKEIRSFVGSEFLHLENSC